MASAVWCLTSPIVKFVVHLIFFLSFSKKYSFIIFMATLLSTNSQYMVPSGFLPCIDYNLPDNKEVLLSPRSLFVLLFIISSYVISCLCE